MGRSPMKMSTVSDDAGFLYGKPDAHDDDLRSIRGGLLSGVLDLANGHVLRGIGKICGIVKADFSEMPHSCDCRKAT